MKSKYTFNEIEEFLDKCNAPGIKILNGTSKQFLKADGSLDTKEYLSTEGGTMSGRLETTGRIGLKGSILELNASDGTTGVYLQCVKTMLRENEMNLSIYDGSSWHKAIHSGNYASYALPVSGGTIKGKSWLPLQIKSDNEDSTAITLSPSSSNGLQLGWTSTQGAFLYNYQNLCQIGVHPDGYAYFKTNTNLYTILHSSNYADQIGDYYLKTSGGVISTPNDVILTVQRTDNSAYTAIIYKHKDTELGRIGFSSVSTPAFRDPVKESWYSLLHTGNYFDYALPLSGGTINGYLYIGSAENISYYPIVLRRAGRLAELANSGDAAVVAFNDGASIGSLKVTASNITFNNKDILTSAGGTITGGKLFLKHTENPYIEFKIGDDVKGGIGYYSAYGTYLYNSAGKLGIKNDGTPYYSDGTNRVLLHSGNYSDYALPLTGGTISGDYAGAQLKIESTYGSGDSYIEFQGGLAYVGYSASGFAFLQYGDEYIAIKSDGAYYKSNKFLTSAGGTISGALRLASTLSLGSSGLYDGATTLILRNASTTADYGTQIVNDSASGETRFILDKSGVFFRDVANNTHTLLHSGNVGEYKAGDSDKLGGITADHTFQYRGSVSKIGGVDGAANLLKSGSYVIDTDYTGAPTNHYGTLLQFIGGETWVSQLAMYGTSSSTPLIYYRRSTSGTASGFTDWKTIAFTDSTVAAARTLEDWYGWSVVSVANSILDLNRNAGSGALYNSANMGLEVECKATEIIFKGYKTDGQLGGRIFLNSSGNVTIGDQDYAGTSNKLWVDGNARVVGDFTLNPAQGVFFTFGVNTSRGAIQAMHDGVAFLPIALNPNGGNVLIGTTTDNGAKFQVAGRIASKTQNGEDKVQLITGDDLGICMTSNRAWMHIAGSGASMFIYNGEWDSAGTGNYIKGITITTDNNIGIGTATPQAKLDVNGDVHVSGNLSVAGITVPSGQSITFVDANGNNHVVSWDDTAGGLKIDDKIITVN